MVSVAFDFKYTFMHNATTNSAFHPHGVDKWVVCWNQMVVITTLVAPSGECYKVKAGMVNLQCNNCVIHTWALQRRASHSGTLYKSSFIFSTRNWKLSYSVKQFNFLLHSVSRIPHPDHSPSDSSHSTHLGLPAPSPPLSPSITPSLFHSKLKAHLFQKSFPP